MSQKTFQQLRSLVLREASLQEELRDLAASDAARAAAELPEPLYGQSEATGPAAV